MGNGKGASAIGDGLWASVLAAHHMGMGAIRHS